MFPLFRFPFREAPSASHCAESGMPDASEEIEDKQKPKKVVVHAAHTHTFPFRLFSKRLQFYFAARKVAGYGF
jgi:hypothetical protein